MKQRIHVIPMGQSEPIHSVSMNCKCHPLPQENGRLAIHNAYDGREAQERQGIQDIKRPWCLVYEEVEDWFLCKDGQPLIKQQSRFS